MVKIKLIGGLKRKLGFDEKEFSIDQPTPLRDLLDLSLDDDRLVILINETSGGKLDTIIKNEDYIMISPVFGGG